MKLVTDRIDVTEVADIPDTPDAPHSFDCQQFEFEFECECWIDRIMKMKWMMTVLNCLVSKTNVTIYFPFAHYEPI